MAAFNYGIAVMSNAVAMVREYLMFITNAVLDTLLKNDETDIDLIHLGMEVDLESMWGPDS